MNTQLTMQKILDVALKLQKQGVDLSKMRVYLGNDDELNGIHNAWYCESIKNNGSEDNNFIVDLINEDFGTTNVKENENFILIS